MKKLIVIVLAVTLSASYFSCKDASELNKNNPPTAVFTYSPTNIDTTTVVTFDASLSSDIEDPSALLTYKWDFTGKQQWTDASSSPTISHLYSKSGTYEVALKVIDSDGWSGTTSKTVMVFDSIQ